MFELIVFYFFAAVLVFAGLMVITARNPVHAALFLVLAFFTCSGLWLLLEAEFLAITLVLVYVGAVMVLFLFVVMMLDINLAPLREGFARYLPLGVLIAFVVAVQIDAERNECIYIVLGSATIRTTSNRALRDLLIADEKLRKQEGQPTGWEATIQRLEKADQTR